MLSDEFICDKEIKKQIKWKKIYGKTRNRVVYEGYSLNNKPCGEGTSYYSNGKKHLEGKFYIKGFIEGKEYYRNGMNKIYERYLNDIINSNRDSIIYTIFLNTQSDKYNSETSDKRKVIDFIAGMTDEMFLKEIEK